MACFYFLYFLATFQEYAKFVYGKIVMYIV